MIDLSEAVLTRMQAEMGKMASAYRGKIKTVNTTTGMVTVTIAAGDVVSLRWLGSYTPVVNDLVLLMRLESEWVVLGKLSQDTTGTTTRVTASFPPASRYIIQQCAIYTLNPDGTKTGAAPTTLVETATTWPVEQGWWSEFIEGSPRKVKENSTGTFWWYPISLPSGATVNACRISFARRALGLSLVSPVIYGHTLANGATPAAAPSTYLHASYGPWSPGTLTPGQSASWDVPSSWVTALLAGTIKGLAIYSGATTDHSQFSDATAALEITYTMPA